MKISVGIESRPDCPPLHDLAWTFVGGATAVIDKADCFSGSALYGVAKTGMAIQGDGHVTRYLVANRADYGGKRSGGRGSAALVGGGGSRRSSWLVGCEELSLKGVECAEERDRGVRCLRRRWRCDGWQRGGNG